MVAFSKIMRGGLALLGGTALVSTSLFSVSFQTLEKPSDPSANGVAKDVESRKPKKKFRELEKAEAVRRQLQDQDGESRERGLVAALPREASAMPAMLDSDVLPAALARSFVDMRTNGHATQSSNYHSSSYHASNAIDSSESTYSLTAKRQGSWWEYRSNERLKVTGVQLILFTQGGHYAYSLHVTVDGQTCGILSHFEANSKTFVQCIVPLYGHDVRIQELGGLSAYMRLYDVKIQEERSGRDDVTEAEVRATICPWISTMLKMKMLRGCAQTRKTLLRVAVASGLPVHLATRHVQENFFNNPSGEQNVCNMEGAFNEHKTSTKNNDCFTAYRVCTPRHEETLASCQSIETENKDCGRPSPEAFNEFFAQIKAGDASPYLSCAELEQNVHKVSITDTNPVGLGTIQGSYCLLLAVFGENVTVDGEHIQAFIHRDNLREVILQRIFPSNGYKYGVRRE